jgi:hypothetical protein
MTLVVDLLSIAAVMIDLRVLEIRIALDRWSCGPLGLLPSDFSVVVPKTADRADHDPGRGSIRLV